MSHTPGPWEVNDGKLGDPYFIWAPKAPRKTVAEIKWIPTFDKQHSHDVTLSNARLIAAAPELLQCCQNALGAYKALKVAGLDDQLPGYETCLADLEKAIAKAKGEVK